jgi:hypothetical protein
MRHKPNKPGLIFIVLLLGVTLAGCSAAWMKPEQEQIDGFLSLAAQGSIGQSFAARYDGLQTFSVYLQPETSGDGVLLLNLRTSRDAGENLRTASIPISEVQAPGYYDLTFPALQASNDQPYFANLRVQGSGSLQVGVAFGDSYQDGALYLDKIPQDTQQLTFRLAYAPRLAAWGLIEEGPSWLWNLAIGLFFFILPGWALLSLLYADWSKLHWAARLALSSGVSLAIYPLLMLWAKLTGISAGPIFAWLPPVLALIALAVAGWRSIKEIPARLRARRSLREFPQKIEWADAALVFLLVLVFASRFWVLRGLAAPLGADSVHHATAIQLILDHNGLMDSWQPYAELQSFSYHFGFHSTAAVYAWATGSSALQATLWTGQILNGLAVLAVCALVARLSNNAWAYPAAVLCAGLLFTMPMFYINWGRYTQLASQIILPAAIFLAWVFLDQQRFKPKLFILSGIGLAGLALTHYRVLLFGACFFPVYWLMDTGRRPLRVAFWRIFWLAAASLLLVAPWIYQALSGKIMDLAVRFLSTPSSQVGPAIQALKSINIFDYLPAWAWLALPLVIGIGLWRRERAVALVSGWWLLLLIAANPSWLQLPGEGLISHGAVITGAYLPVAALLGTAVGWAAEAILPVTRQRTARVAGALGFFILMAGIGLWGARQRLSDVHAGQAALLTRPDLRAAAWIQANLPEDASFLVNSQSGFGSQWNLGSDAGWWLPLVSQRKATVPPMIYTVEQGAQPDLIEQTNSLAQAIREQGVNHPDTLALLAERGITHVFIGQRHSNQPGGPFALQPDQMLNQPAFRLIYHDDRVWIFEIVR